jgi:hypothetical protein
MIRVPRTTLAAILIVLVIAVALIVAIGSAGTLSIRTADTHNTTAAIKEFNTWTLEQKELDTALRGMTEIIGAHVADYNTGIATDTPDYALLRQNLAQDRQVLDRWKARLDDLSAATERFEEETAPLTYDTATRQQVKSHLATMAQYMKIYEVHLGNAREHLIEYTNNAEAYLAPDDPEYWNEQHRQDAIAAMTAAAADMDKGDAALNDLLREAKELEKLQ